MFEISADFRGKESKIESKDCVIAKVIRLPGEAFDLFSNNLLRDQDFIIENNTILGRSEDGKLNCILIIGEGRRDGIIVDSQGYNYARNTALLPYAEDILFMNQYPALAALNKKLATMVNTIAEQAGVSSPNGRGVVNLDDWGDLLGVDFSSNSTLRATVLAMLDNRSEIRDWELDGNQLIVRRLDFYTPSTKDLADPSVTSADMYAYGYTWDGMIPLGKERALELFDVGHEIFRLYKDDAEGAVETREEIMEHDGLFGTEDPDWEKLERVQTFQAFVVNTIKHRNGENVGEWLTLPADADTLRDLLERINVEKPSEVAFAAGLQDAFTVTAIRMPIEDKLREYVSKHGSLDELNMLAYFYDKIDDFELDKLQAILSTNIADIGSSNINSIINLLHEENFTAYDFIYAHNEDALGRWYVDTGDTLPEGVTIEQFGRNYAKEENGKFVPDLDGYIKRLHKNVVTIYDGKVPAEHKIAEAALRGLYSKQPERDLELASNEKSSVMDEIKASRQNSKESKVRAASKAKDWDVQKTKMNKEEPDL